VSRRWKEMEETVRSGGMTPAAAAAELGRVAGIDEPEGNEC